MDYPAAIGLVFVPDTVHVVNEGICQARFDGFNSLCPLAIRNFNNHPETDSLAQTVIAKYRQREIGEFDKAVSFGLSAPLFPSA